MSATEPSPVFASVVSGFLRDLALGDPPGLLDPLQDRDAQLLAGRLALGVERRGLERERLAVEVDVARRVAGRSGSRGRPASRRPRRPTLSCGSCADEPQRLLLGEPLGRELDVELARRVGRAVERRGRRAAARTIGRPASGVPYW